MTDRVTKSTSSRVRIDADAVQAVHRAAIAVYPEESCGLMLGHWRGDGEVVVKQAVLVPNTAPAADRHHRFEIEPRLLLHWERLAQRAGLSIVGFFHSHPDQDPRPSATDASLAWPSYVYVIVSAVGRAGVDGPEPREPLVTGMAAWTFHEPSTSFVELPVEVEVAQDQIEYFI